MGSDFSGELFDFVGELRQWAGVAFGELADAAGEGLGDMVEFALHGGGEGGDLSFSLAGGFREIRERWRQEGEVAHGHSKFPAKGAVLEGGEEGVQFGEVRALRGLLALDGFDDGGEFLLEGERGEHKR